MKHFNQIAVLTAAVFACSLVANVARACPMCFNGADSNSSAFLYGSLFLMIVPTATIGSLLYWAYKRYKASEAFPLPPPPVAEVVEQVELEAQPAPSLRLVQR